MTDTELRAKLAAVLPPSTAMNEKTLDALVAIVREAEVRQVEEMRLSAAMRWGVTSAVFSDVSRLLDTELLALKSKAGA